MARNPSHPLRLLGILWLGGILPLSGVGILTALSVRLGWIAFSNYDAEYLLYPALLAAGCAILFCWWLFRPRPLPTDPSIPAEDIPALTELLTRTMEGVRGAKARRVWIHRGFQVNLHTLPVFGPLGWASHGWALGVFSLMNLTPRELEAALIWDQAFWSRQHSWLNLEAKRILQFWRDLIRSLERKQAAAPLQLRTRLLVNPVLAWARWIDRIGDPFRFDQVVMADRSVGNALGPLTTAQMLTKEALTEFQVNTVWFVPWSESLQAVPSSPLSEVQHYLKAWPGAEVQVRFEALLDEVVAGPGALRFRLEALGVALEPPRPPQRSAWEQYLLDDAPDLAGKIEEGWRSELEQFIATRDRQRGESLAKFRDWASRDKADPLPAGYLPEMAHLAVKHGDEAETKAWLSRWTEADPRSGDLLALLARFHLRQTPDQGCAMLERLRAAHPLNASVASDIWAEHLARTQPGSDEAMLARRQAYEAAQIWGFALEERKSVSLSDDLRTHEAPESQLKDLRIWLGRIDGLARAYVVRKEVHHIEESPVYLVVIVRRGFLKSVFESSELGRWQSQLVKTLPPIGGAKVFLLVLRGRQRFREGKLRRLGAPLVSR